MDKTYNQLKYEITRRTNQFLHNITLDLSCRFDTDFYYVPDDDIIGISIIADTQDENDFVDFLSEHFNLDDVNGKFDWYVWNTLHEVGHYFTIDNHDGWWYNLQEWAKDRIGNMKSSKLKNYLYWYLPIEWDATKWAVEYMLAHQQECESLYKDISKIVRKYIKED